ncbi:MAG: Ppx/GppA phosphatase family protein [Kineosporiaceae bacterium]
MPRVAAFDCGTNSLRLLIADVDPEAGTLVDVDRRMEVVRLGEGVDRTGVISAEALERALRVCEFYAALCRDAGVERARFVATSASRDASNRDDFTAGVASVLGVTPEVVPGSEEAALSFVGATADLAAAHPAPYLVVDLGGGSTEFVLGDDHAEAARSVDIGCVRMAERHLTADPPSHDQVLAAVADIDAAVALAARDVPLARTATLVGVAGTVTTVMARVLGLEQYDPGVLHGASAPVDAVLAACDELISMSREDRAALPYMHPGRVDVIGAGALVWRRIVERVAAEAGITEVVSSEHDILDGVAWSLVLERE